VVGNRPWPWHPHRALDWLDKQISQIMLPGYPTLWSDAQTGCCGDLADRQALTMGGDNRPSALHLGIGESDTGRAQAGQKLLFIEHSVPEHFLIFHAQ